MNITAALAALTTARNAALAAEIDVRTATDKVAARKAANKAQRAAEKAADAAYKAGATAAQVHNAIA